MSAEKIAAEKPGWSWKVWVIWSVPLSALYVAIAVFDSTDAERKEMLGAAFFAPFAVAVFYSIYVVVRRWIFRIGRRQLHSENLTQKAEALQDELKEDFFTNLVRINFKYLDKYYLQTQEQADKSFLMCLIASILGLLIIFAGIAMMFLDKTKPAYITTATGMVSQFIAAVFFYLYNRTIVSMGGYHQKLVITQNIALALKITGELPNESRSDAQAILINALTRDVNRILAGGQGSADGPLPAPAHGTRTRRRATPGRLATRTTPAPSQVEH